MPTTGPGTRIVADRPERPVGQLRPPRVFGINYSDGTFSNLSPVSVFGPGPIQKLHAVRHNPFPPISSTFNSAKHRP